MGPDAMILVFWMLSFKPTFSLSSFTINKRFFNYSLLSAIRVVSSAYLRLLIFLPAILISACASSSSAFLMMYSACKLNKQGDNIQSWHTPFPIWNQTVVPCPIPCPPLPKSYTLSFPLASLLQFLRAEWSAVSWAVVLILSQIKLYSHLSCCAFFISLQCWTQELWLSVLGSLLFLSAKRLELTLMESWRWRKEKYKFCPTLLCLSWESFNKRQFKKRKQTSLLICIPYVHMGNTQQKN